MDLKKLIMTTIAVVTTSMLPLSAQGYYYQPTYRCCNNFVIGADFLWWKPCVDGLDFAIENTIETAFLPVEDAKIKYVEPDWEPGVRAYIGLQNVCDCFNLQLTWTYLDADKTSTAASFPFNVVPTYGIYPFEGSFLFDEASCKWSLEYHTIDGIISFPLSLMCGNCLDFIPYTGVRGLVINQSKKSDFDDRDRDGFLLMNQKADFCGAGPIIGAELSRTFCGCWNYFLNVDAAIVVGEKKLEDDYEVTVPGTNLVAYDYRAKGDEWVCFPGWHLGTGIGYLANLCGWDLDFKIKYEFTQWINAPDFTILNDPPGIAGNYRNSGSISLHGVSAGLTIGF